MKISELGRNLENDGAVDLYRKLSGFGTPDFSGTLSPEKRFSLLLREAGDLVGLKRDDEVELFSCPGGLPLLGKFTGPYGGGQLGLAHHLDVLGLLKKRSDEQVLLSSHGYDRLIHVDLAAPIKEEEKGEPSALLKAVYAFLKGRFYDIRGFEGSLHSLLTPGSGFASSTVLAVFFAAVFILFGRPADRRDEALGEREEEDIFLAAQESERLVFEADVDANTVYLALKGGTCLSQGPEARPTLQKKIEDHWAEWDYVFVYNDLLEDNPFEDEAEESIRQDLSLLFAPGARGSPGLPKATPEDFRNSLASLRGDVSDRALLRALYCCKEIERLNFTRGLFSDPGGLGTILDFLKASGKDALRLLYRRAGAAEENARLVLGFETAEAYLEDKGIPGAVKQFGNISSGPLLTCLPRREAEAFNGHLESLFGKGTGKILYPRSAGISRLV